MLPRIYLRQFLWAQRTAFARLLDGPPKPTPYNCWGPTDRIHVSKQHNVPHTHFNTRSGHITIEGDAFCAYNVMLLTGTHDIHLGGAERRSDDCIPSEGRDIYIEDGAFICSGAIILGPCRIGRNAVVAAGSVVRKDVAPWTLVAGNPAVVVQEIEQAVGAGHRTPTAQGGRI